MAQIDTSQTEGVPAVLPSTQTPDRYQRIPTNPNDFGAAVGTGLEHAGQGATNVAKFYGEVAADNAYNGFQSGADKLMYGDPTQVATDENGQVMMGPDGKPLPDTGFLGKSGEAAMRAAPEVSKQLDDLIKETRSTLGSPAQQFQFDQYSRRYRSMLGGRIGEHTDQQTKLWYQKVNADTQANGVAAIAANPKDDQAFYDGLGQMTAGAIKTLQIQGLDQDQDAVSAALRTVQIGAVETRVKALAPQDPFAALKVFNEHNDLLASAPNYDSISEHVTAGISANIEDRARLNLDDGKKQFDAIKDQLPPNAVERIGERLSNIEYTNNIRQAQEEARAERAQEKAASYVRVGLDRDLQNTDAMLRMGIAPTDYPTEARIRAAFPNDPGRAEEIMGEVSDRRTAGIAIAKLPNMSPDQIEAQTRSLAPSATDTTDFSKKARIFSYWSGAVEGHYKQLAQDPAGSIVGNPTAYPSAAASWQNLQNIKDPQQFSAAAQDYASHVISVQDNLGVPESMRALLPTQTATNLADSIQADAQQAPAKLKQLQDQYGAVYPQVWRDMVRLGKLSPEYQAVGALDDQRDGALLANWIAGGKDSPRNIDELVGGSKIKKTLDDYIETSDDLRKYTTSLIRSGASTTLVGSVIQSVKDLAYAKAVGGNNPSAGSDSINSFIGKYTFLPNGGARIPHAVADAVTENAARQLGGLKTGDISVPAIYGLQNAPKPDEYIDLVKSAPTWVTSPNSDSLMLMDPYGRFVRDRAGKPLEVRFNAPAPLPAPPNPTFVPGVQVGGQ